MVFFKVSTIAVLNSSLEAAAQSLIGGTQGCSGKQPKSSGASKHSLAMAAMVAISNLAHNIKHTPSRNLGKDWPTYVSEAEKYEIRNFCRDRDMNRYNMKCDIKYSWKV